MQRANSPNARQCAELPLGIPVLSLPHDGARTGEEGAQLQVPTPRDGSEDLRAGLARALICIAPYAELNGGPRAAKFNSYGFSRPG